MVVMLSPEQEKYKNFVANLEATFGGMGGTITQQFRDDKAWRISFEGAGALDITMGPGGHPIVGRGGGMMVMPRITPNYQKAGPGTPSITSSFDVLGGIVRTALQSASRDEDPARKFGNTISYQLGANRLRDGEGSGAFYLPKGWETTLPEAAQRRLAATYYASAIPLGAMAQTYPGYVPLGQANAGLMPVIQENQLAAAAIGGRALGGGKRKQSGVQPYMGVGLSTATPGQFTTATGLPHSGHIQETLMPISGSITPMEGQSAIREGAKVEFRRPMVQHLAGWDAERLSRITEIRQGAVGRGGSAIDILMSGEESMYSWRAPHAETAQVASAYVSLPKSFEQTNWYQSLDEAQRKQYRLEGGVIHEGEEVPGLVMQVIQRGSASGAVSTKGGGLKAQGYEVDLRKRIVGGLTPEEIKSVGTMYEEGPKEWMTRAASIGSALGILGPNKPTLIQESGELNLPVAEKIAEAIAQRTKPVTFQFDVNRGLAWQYLPGSGAGGKGTAVSGIESAEWQESGLLRVTRTAPLYKGPAVEWFREEYPMGQSKLNPEELAHMRSYNPELYARVQKVGYKPEAHQAVAQAFAASYGMIDVPKGAQQWADVRDTVQSLAGISPERGDLIRALAKTDVGKSPIVMEGGMVVPAASKLMGLSAENIAGEEVSKLIAHAERALVSNDPIYLETAAEMLGGEGAIKELQSLGVPGVSGPGVARSEIPVGEVRLGRSQFRKFAREFYGHAPSRKEMREITSLAKSGQIIGNFNRFPQSDVYGQTNTTARLTLGGPSREISFNPLMAGEQRGDTDSDIYRFYSPVLERDKSGKLVTNYQGMGQVATEESVLNNMINMVERANPGSVEQARKEVAGLNIGNDPIVIAGAVLSRANYFANEVRKHQGKEQVVPPAVEGTKEYIVQQLQKAQSSADILEKQQAGIEAKTFMGRTYNALRRNVAERARSMYGSESEITKSIFSAAAGGYQSALDLARYNPLMPLGNIKDMVPDPSTGKLTAVDPAMSFGLARLMEGFGTMSFLHSGGLMKNITSGLKYDEFNVWQTDDETGDIDRVKTRGYTSPWLRMQGSDVSQPLAMMRNVIGQSAVFGGEFTPKQMAAMIATGDDSIKATEEAIARARTWAGGVTGLAEDALSSKKGLAAMSDIWNAAGLLDEKTLWTSQAPLVSALRDTMLLRTREQMYKADISGDQGYKDRIKKQLEELRPSFEKMTGMTLEAGIAGAIERQAPISLMGGDILSASRTPIDRAQAMVRELFGGTGPVRGPQDPSTMKPIWASELGAGDEKAFANMLTRAHSIQSDWGGRGEAVHKAVDAGMREALPEGASILSETELKQKGTLRSLFGMSEEVGFTGKPDIAIRGSQKEGYHLYDIKSYKGPYDERQLQVYAAMLGQAGMNITGASYVNIPYPGDDADMEQYGKDIGKQLVEGTYDKNLIHDVKLADTQQERLEVARQHFADVLEQRKRLMPLAQNISPKEAEELSGLKFGAWMDKAKELYARANERMITGAVPPDAGRAQRAAARQQQRLGPLGEISQRFGIDLPSLGVESARVLTTEEYEKEIATMGDLPAGSKGFSIGTSITVAEATEEEATKFGIDAATLTRRRVAHEAGHVYARSNPDILNQARAQLDQDIAGPNPRLDQKKLEAVYGANWREKGAEERVAMGIAGAFGALDTYSGNVSPLDVALNRAASSAGAGAPPPGGPGSGGGGAAAGAGGGGGWGAGAAFLFGATAGGPGGQGGPGGPGGPGAPPNLAGMTPQQQGQYWGAFNRSMLGWGQKPSLLNTINARKVAFQIAQGDLGALESQEAEGVLRGGNYKTWNALTAFSQYSLKGGQAKGTNLAIIEEMGKAVQTPAVMQSIGMTPQEGQAAIDNLRSGMVPKSLIDSLNSFGRQLVSASKRLEEHADIVKKATVNYDDLNKVQKKSYEQVIKDAATVKQLEGQVGQFGAAGLPWLVQAQRGSQLAGGVQGWAELRAQRQESRAYGDLSSSPFTGIATALGGAAKELTSGFGLFRVNRLWQMFGGRAIAAQQAAMQEEMGVQAGLASWAGGGDLGPVTQSLLSVQARKSAAQASMGRGFQMSYGGVQNALAGMGGELAGVAAPALSAGLIAGTLFGGPAGLAVGGAVGLYAGASYLNTIGSDVNERDYRMGSLGTKAPSLRNIPDMLPAIGAFWGSAISNFLQGKPPQTAEERSESVARGTLMREGLIGLFEGDRAAQSVVLRDWSERTAKEEGVVDAATWARTAGEWQAYSGNLYNLNDLPTDMLKEALGRGYSVKGVGALAQQLGGTTSQFRPLMEALVAAPYRASTEVALQQYAGAGQLGLVGLDYFTSNINQMQEMTGWQNQRFQRMMSGDRDLWSRYASGQSLGLTGTAMDILGQVGRQPWMITTEPDTGLPLHTTTGSMYAGALATQEARIGGQRGIQWAMYGLQDRSQDEAYRAQQQQFQMAYAYQTGATMPGMGGSVPSGLMGMLQQTGGMWGLQDQSRAMSYNWQQYQFGFQQQQMQRQDRYWQENWQANWDRLQVQQGWESQQEQRQTKRYAAQDEHFLFQWGMQENMAQLQFGWQMEDLDENIRFSTGRQKLRLMRSKERATISESMRSEGHQEAKDYWEKQKEWRDQDLETAKSHREQMNEWKEEDLERSKKQHDETVAAEQEHFDRTRAHFQETWALETKRITLEREFWKESQKAQADEMVRIRAINIAQRNLRNDQLTLSYDAQNAMARFQIGITEIGRGVDVLTSKIAAFNAQVAKTTTPSPGKKYHDGGPVGLVAPSPSAGVGEVNATLQTGEYVVPKNGALVMRDERVIDLLTRIANLLEAGNGRFTIMVAQPERTISDVNGYLDAAYRN